MARVTQSVAALLPLAFLFLNSRSQRLQKCMRSSCLKQSLTLVTKLKIRSGASGPAWTRQFRSGKSKPGSGINMRKIGINKKNIAILVIKLEMSNMSSIKDLFCRSLLIVSLWASSLNVLLVPKYQKKLKPYSFCQTLTRAGVVYNFFFFAETGPKEGGNKKLSYFPLSLSANKALSLTLESFPQ